MNKLINLPSGKKQKHKKVLKMEPDTIDMVKYKLKLLNLRENPYGFFEYLKICKHGDGTQMISHINQEPARVIKPARHYNLLTFRIYICELIFNGINLFPGILEYKISCKNENGETHLTFGLFKEINVDGHPCMCKFQSNHEFGKEPFFLELRDIKSLYMSNRYPDVDHPTISALIVSMYTGGSLPLVNVSFKINPSNLKNTLKFK